MLCKPTLLSVACSVFVRLPWGFLFPFVVLTAAWILQGYKSLTSHLRLNVPFAFLNGIPYLENLDDAIHAALLVLIFIVGVLLIYNLSVFINLGLLFVRQKWAAWRRPPQKDWDQQPDMDESADAPPAAGEQDSTSTQATQVQANSTNGQKLTRKLLKNKNIGIVLAGGGAKGAFQAGAMKAIYQFLDKYDALEQVKVIAATSIGSWNALFWLADLIQPRGRGDEKSEHEKWWRGIRLRKLVTPSWYVPAMRNSFFRTTPWEEQFETLFNRPDIKARIATSKIKFYFTRSHVRSGKLECVTNNNDATHMPRVSFKFLKDPKEDIRGFMDDIKTGVFASMDLPPLFPYVELATDYFEDGGVIDNLPIIFPATDGCDLIFVLPLNSDFYAEPDFRSIVGRFFRVMDVRQGVLERNSMKILYLYNEIAALREHVKKLHAYIKKLSKLAGKEKSHDKSKMLETDLLRMKDSPLTRALDRKHKQLRIFAVCPVKSFVRSTLDTQELWKYRQAGIALDVMYEATQELLDVKFGELMEHEKIQVALIGREGGYTLDDNF